MEKIKYTPKELKKIKNHERKIAKEIISIAAASSLESISVQINDKWYSEMWHEELPVTYTIEITDWYVSVESSAITKKRIVEKEFGLNLYTNVIPEDLIFINNYEEIRDKILEKAKQGENRKHKILDEIERKISKHNSDILIDLNFPESLNQTTIEVEEIDGRKIGTIDFGSHTIKIITDGDIELVRRERVKQKKK